MANYLDFSGLYAFLPAPARRRVHREQLANCPEFLHLHVYKALDAGHTGLVALIAGVGPIQPLLLVLIACALIAKEFWIHDPSRTVLINAVAATVLLVLPFAMLTIVNGAVQNIIHQMGG
ncbi:hypothetical protein [Deinococcus sp.]|uniref:hypothetical protein n=1 Tax=Deinococcus sp. TaxID=47478 RepID=UPI003C7C4B47